MNSQPSEDKAKIVFVSVRFPAALKQDLDDFVHKAKQPGRKTSRDAEVQIAVRRRLAETKAPPPAGTEEAPLSKETQKIVKLLEGLGPKVRESVLVLVNAAVRNSEARSDSDPGEDSARQGEPKPKRDKKAS